MNRRDSAQGQRAAVQHVAVGEEGHVVHGDRPAQGHRAGGAAEEGIVQRGVVPGAVRPADAVAVRAPERAGRVPDAGTARTQYGVVRIPVPVHGLCRRVRRQQGRERAQPQPPARRRSRVDTGGGLAKARSALDTSDCFFRDSSPVRMRPPRRAAPWTRRCGSFDSSVSFQEGTGRLDHEFKWRGPTTRRRAVPVANDVGPRCGTNVLPDLFKFRHD